MLKVGTLMMLSHLPFSVSLNTRFLDAARQGRLGAKLAVTRKGQFGAKIAGGARQDRVGAKLARHEKVGTKQTDGAWKGRFGARQGRLVGKLLANARQGRVDDKLFSAKLTNATAGAGIHSFTMEKIQGSRGNTQGPEGNRRRNVEKSIQVPNYEEEEEISEDLSEINLEQLCSLLYTQVMR